MGDLTIKFNLIICCAEDNCCKTCIIWGFVILYFFFSNCKVISNIYWILIFYKLFETWFWILGVKFFNIFCSDEINKAPDGTENIIVELDVDLFDEFVCSDPLLLKSTATYKPLLLILDEDYVSPLVEF